MKRLKHSILLLPIRRAWWLLHDNWRQFVAWRGNVRFERIPESYVVPHVMTMEETLDEVLNKHVSLARFGDGEFDMIAGEKMIFQSYDGKLSSRLREVLLHPESRCLNAIPGVFGRLDLLVRKERYAWRVIMGRRREQLIKLLEGTSQRLGDAFVSRFYLRFKAHELSERILAKWRRLFEGRNLLIVEGRYSRMGVGNNLFSGAKTIRRIWCPPKDAFAEYDAILAKIIEVAQPDDLILLALGATASVLAHDLARAGYWAVDTGHLDIEYFWMQMGVREKTAIPGRYMSEVPGGQEQIPVDGEIEANHVVAVIGERKS